MPEKRVFYFVRPYLAASVLRSVTSQLAISLAIHTLRVENNLLLSLLSIESSLPSEEGGGDQQMTPELLNEAFQLNPHNMYNSDPAFNVARKKAGRSRASEGLGMRLGM
jgi:hypothetical protein